MKNVLTLFIIIACCLSASATPVSVDSTTLNSNNEIVDLTIGGQTIAASRLISPTLTQYAAGGTAVYLEVFHPSPSDPYWAAELPSREILPVPARKQHALGLWIGVSHIVRDHPVFHGLPVNRTFSGLNPPAVFSKET